MLGVRVRSPIRGRRRVHQPRNRGPAPAGARNAKSNCPTCCPPDELAGHERMYIEDGINLGRGHIRPAEAERRDAPLHRPEHEARFLAHRLRRLVSAPDDAPFIALTRYLAAQTSEIDGRAVLLFAGVFAIFGHGSVAGVGEALYEAREWLPTLRAHNEQAMGLAAIAFATLRAHNEQAMGF